MKAETLEPIEMERRKWGAKEFSVVVVCCLGMYAHPSLSTEEKASYRLCQAPSIGTAKFGSPLCSTTLFHALAHTGTLTFQNIVGGQN